MMPEPVDPPESSPEFAALLGLVLSVLGDDPKLLKSSLTNAAAVCRHISEMDLTVVRLRARHNDEKVRRDFAQAAVWLRGVRARYESLGPL